MCSRERVDAEHPTVCFFGCWLKKEWNNYECVKADSTQHLATERIE